MGPDAALFAGGVPVVDVGLGRVGYRVPALGAAHGGAFSAGGDVETFAAFGNEGPEKFMGMAIGLHALIATLRRASRRDRVPIALHRSPR